MSVQSVRPEVAELEFHLFGRPLHPELFEIVATHYLQSDGQRITMHLTATGHLISWDHPDVHLAEITTSIHQPLPHKRRLLRRRMLGESTHEVQCAHGIRYQMQLQVESLSPDVFFHLNEEMLADGSRRGLLHRFPAKHRMSAAPLGYVSFEKQADCLFFSSTHTFPDETCIVKTQSLIELP